MVNQVDYSRLGRERRTDEARKRALFNHDAVNYSRLCDALGVEPENDELYVQGKLIRPTLESKTEGKVTLTESEQRAARGIYRFTVESGLPLEFYSDIVRDVLRANNISQVPLNGSGKVMRLNCAGKKSLIDYAKKLLRAEELPTQREEW